MKKVFYTAYIAHVIGTSYCLGQIEQDKMLHYNISQALSGAGSSVAMYANPHRPFRSALIGAGFSLTVGTLKELIYDGLIHKGVASFRDEWANISGVAVYNICFTFYIKSK